MRKGMLLVVIGLPLLSGCGSVESYLGLAGAPQCAASDPQFDQDLNACASKRGSGPITKAYRDVPA